MRLKLTLFAFITIIAFVFNCSKSDEPYTVEIKDGVKYVHNKAPLWGDEPKVGLEFVQKIGDLETEDENFALYLPQDVGIDDNGNIYVLDAGNFRIQKFDMTGNYLKTLGRRGEGPGELRAPESIQIGSNNHIYVCDSRKRSMLELDKDGKEIRNINSSNLRFRNFIILNSVNLLSNSAVRSEDTKPYTEPQLQILDSNFNIIREFCSPYDFKNSTLNSIMNEINFTVDKNDNIYVTFSRQNRIEKYSKDGKLEWKADRSLPYKMSKPGKPEFMLLEGPEGRFGSAMKIMEIDPINTFSEKIAIDDKGRCWVKSVVNQASGSKREDFKPIEYTFEIFDKDGFLLCRLPLPENINISSYRIFGNRIFFIDRTTEMCVYEYKIVEK